MLARVSGVLNPPVLASASASKNGGGENNMEAFSPLALVAHIIGAKKSGAAASKHADYWNGLFNPEHIPAPPPIDEQSREQAEALIESLTRERPREHQPEQQQPQPPEPLTTPAGPGEDGRRTAVPHSSPAAPMTDKLAALTQQDAINGIVSQLLSPQRLADINNKTLTAVCRQFGAGGGGTHRRATKK